MKLSSDEGKTDTYNRWMKELYVKQTPIIGLLPQIANKLIYSKMANGQEGVEMAAK